MPGAQESEVKDPAGGETDEQKAAAKAAADVAAAEAAKNKDQDDLSKLTPEELAAEVKKLRKENAERRTKNKALDEQKKSADELMGKVRQALGLADDKASPEEMANQLKIQNSALELELGITQLALQNGIPADQMDYFGFLFRKGLDGLKEGDELDEEAIGAIVAKVNSVGGGAKKTSTGIETKNNPDPNKGGDTITLEKFVGMNTGEKTALYVKNPTLYNSLFEEASKKRLLK